MSEWYSQIPYSVTGTSAYNPSTLEHGHPSFRFVGTSSLNQAWSPPAPPWTYQNYQLGPPLKQGVGSTFSGPSTFFLPASRPPGALLPPNAYVPYQHPPPPTFARPPVPPRPYPTTIYQPSPPASVYNTYPAHPRLPVPNIPYYFHGFPPNKLMMMSSPTSPRSPTVGSPLATICWQSELTQKCAELNLPPPEFHLKSDRRGGRTAWQSWVAVKGGKFESRFSYAGHHNAQEDAAEVALKWLLGGSPQIPTTPAIPTTYPGFTHPYTSVAPSSSPPSSHYTLGTMSGNVSSQTSAAVSVPHRQHPQPPIQHHQFQGFNVN